MKLKFLYNLFCQYTYSFRVPANGVCFFFLLALVAEGLPKAKESLNRDQERRFEFLKYQPAIIGGALIICSAMLVFSTVRALSLMYFQNAINSAEMTESEENIQKAIALDNREPSFRYFYGVQLYNSNRAAEAVPQIRFAIDEGIAASIAYYNLASAQISARHTDEAGQTFSEALRVYPRSVFLLTAYASFLENSGKELQAQTEYAKAFQTNPEQAASWQIAHAQGFAKLSQLNSQNKNLVEVMELKPAEGIYALLDFQRQKKPNLVRK